MGLGNRTSKAPRPHTAEGVGFAVAEAVTSDRELILISERRVRLKRCGVHEALSAMEVPPLKNPQIAYTARCAVAWSRRASSLGYILVTADKREFATLKELRCENWLG